MNSLNLKMEHQNPTVSKVAESMLTIHNPTKHWKYGSTIKVNDTLAVVISLLEKEAHALSFKSLVNQNKNLEI